LIGEEVATLRQTLAKIRRKARCAACGARHLTLAPRYDSGSPSSPPALPADPPPSLAQVATGRWQNWKPWTKLANRAWG
jgi:hypothetical protein